MLSTTQLPLFLLAPKTRQNAGEQALLLMAYSGTKLDRDARAIDLYRGVMYASYRAHVRSEAAPRVLILSARHGFLQPDSEIAPYDERMTRQRADQTLADLPRYLQPAAWPSRVGLVLLAGGAEYRRVMCAALAHRYGPTLPAPQETSGGIGMQRSQLGAFLDGLKPALRDQIGQQANGTPLYRAYGWIEAGATLLYRATPALPSRKARVMSVFNGPSGPTADVEVEEIVRGRAKICPRWVSVRDAPSFHRGAGMSDLDRKLHRDAIELCQTRPATPEKLVALAHAGLKAWARVGNLQFAPEKWYALLQEIMRYCAWECLLACCFASRADMNATWLKSKARIKRLLRKSLCRPVGRVS